MEPRRNAKLALASLKVWHSSTNSKTSGLNLDNDDPLMVTATQNQKATAAKGVFVFMLGPRLWVVNSFNILNDYSSTPGYRTSCG